MKILEINKFHNARRGADAHYLDVCALLRSHGHEVAEFSMHGVDNAPSAWSAYFLSRVGYGKGFSMWEKIKGAGRMFFSFEAHRKINKLLDEFKPDVVHVHNIYHQMSPTILFAIKKRKIPIIMTVHDFKIINPNHSMMLNGEPYNRCRNHRYYQCFLDKAVKNSYAKSFLAMCEAYWHYWLGTFRKNVDLYIAPSRFVANRLKEWGIAEEKTVVIPHFLFAGKRFIDDASSKSFALLVTQIGKNDGLLEFVQEFRNIKAASLYIAGGVEEDILEGLADMEHVRCLGFLGKKELNARMEQADCIVSLSKLPETFGLVALNSIMLGVPFFGFNVGAYGEIIGKNNGKLAENDAKLSEIVKDYFSGKISFNKATIAREAQDSFSSEKAYESLEKIMSEMAKSGLTKARKSDTVNS